MPPNKNNINKFIFRLSYNSFPKFKIISDNFSIVLSCILQKITLFIKNIKNIL